MPNGVWVSRNGRRVLRNPNGYLTIISAFDRSGRRITDFWIGGSSEPKEALRLVRLWCPWPTRLESSQPLVGDELARLREALRPWRVRRGAHWYRAAPEMKTALAELERWKSTPRS